MIRAGDVSMTATLNGSATARRLLEALPVEGAGNRWGREVYFSIPLVMDEEDPQTKAPSGTIAYWPPGNALCVFFGQTPYSGVNVVGMLDGDPNAFSKVRDGDPISVSVVD